MLRALRVVMQQGCREGSSPSGSALDEAMWSALSQRQLQGPANVPVPPLQALQGLLLKLLETRLPQALQPALLARALQPPPACSHPSDGAAACALPLEQWVQAQAQAQPASVGAGRQPPIPFRPLPRRQLTPAVTLLVGSAPPAPLSASGWPVKPTS